MGDQLFSPTYFLTIRSGAIRPNTLGSKISKNSLEPLIPFLGSTHIITFRPKIFKKYIIRPI